MINILTVIYTHMHTIFYLKYQTAINNSKWECLEKFREVLILEVAKQSVVTKTKVVVDCLNHKTTYWTHFNAAKQKHITKYSGTWAF